MAIFETIRHWRSCGLSRREIARRLRVDVKTVRRHLKKIEHGARVPIRSSPGSKLDPYKDRIKERVECGCSGWTIYLELRSDSEFTGSYELVKKHVAILRRRDPQVFERLEHLPGAEAQADFGELFRVRHQGQMVRTWVYVTVWPHSTWRYAEVVLDQQVPTFLACVQNGFLAADAVPERFTIDNLRPGVFYEHFQERAYQREFAALCAHYDTMPNAVRVRRPTDKGAVENGVGVLKRALRGRPIETLEELRAAIAAIVRELNARPNSRTGKRPNDVIPFERRGPLPERYPLAFWSQHRVRSDCHVQVRSNFYSVPYTLVGKEVVVRLDAASVTAYSDFEIVARHERCVGRRGQTITDRAHYPPHKRRSTQEIHHERVARIRAVGGGAAAFYSGLLRSRDHVHSDAWRALMRLIEQTDAVDLDRACARAAHFGNYTLDALRVILERRLFELPLDDLTLRAAPAVPQIAIVRPLAAYAELYVGTTC